MVCPPANLTISAIVDRGAEGGHHEEVGLGLAEVGLIAFLIRI